MKKYKNFEFSLQINETREKTFYKILSDSTNVELPAEWPVLMIKANLKKMQLDFEELIFDFIPSQTQDFFKIQFFEKLYDNFIHFILRIKKYTEQEQHKIKDVLGYLINMSYSINPGLISNFKKVKSMYEMIGSEIDEIIQMYNEAQVLLPKNELRDFLRAFYDVSPKRDKFIDKIF